MTKERQRNLEEPNRDMKELVRTLIENTLKKYQDIHLTETDILNYLGNTDISLQQVFERLLLQSDLESLGIQHLYSLFPQYKALVAEHYPEFVTSISTETLEDGFSAMDFSLDQVMALNISYPRRISQEALDSVRRAILSQQANAVVESNDEEIQALEDFSMKIVESAASPSEGDPFADPVEFKKNIDWRWLIKQQVPAFFKINNAGTFGIFLPEKGWSDHLSTYGSVAQQIKSELPPYYDPSDTSNALVVTNPNQILNLFTILLQNQDVRSAFVKTYFLYTAQQQIYSKIIELIDDVAEEKKKVYEAFHNMITMYFLHQFLLLIPKGKSLTLLATFPEYITGDDASQLDDDSLVPEEELIPYLITISATRAGLYEVKITQGSINQRFTDTTGSDQTLIGDYVLGLKYRKQDGEQDKPVFYYGFAQEDITEDTQLSLKRIDLSHDDFWEQSLSMLFDGFSCFSMPALLELMTLEPEKLEAFFNYIEESPSPASLLTAMDQLSMDKTAVGRLFLVPEQFPLLFAREPKAEEAGLKNIKGISVSVN